MSATLQFSKSQRNTFLHVSPDLYRKILNGKLGFKLPLIQISFNNNTEMTFWCVQDLNVEDKYIQINDKFGEIITLTHNTKYDIHAKEVAPVNLKKVIVSVPSDTDDWRIIHNNFDAIEDLILDQIRLIRRGDRIPIFTEFKTSPIWIKIEEFGGYQQPEKYGVLHEDTELIVIADTSEELTVKTDRMTQLKILPSDEFEFAANSCHNLSNSICSSLGYSFKIFSDDSIPPGFIRVSNCILERLFKLPAKVPLNILNRNEGTENFVHCKYFSVDGGVKPDVDVKFAESIFTHKHGFILKTNDDDSEAGEVIKVCNSITKSSSFNELADFIKTVFIDQKVMLFHGNEGSGKSQMIFEAIQQLNFSESFNLPIKYIDFTAEPTSSQLENNLLISHDYLLIFDHFDEYFEFKSTDDTEESINLQFQYIKLCKKIIFLLNRYRRSKIILVARSPSSLAKLFSLHQIPVDLLYSLPKNHTNKKSFSRPLNRWENVWGMEAGKASLEQFIFNPLRFAAIYKANNMKIHAGVLLSGPSGSGKTFLARQFIRQFGIPSIEIRGPELLDKYVGASERAVRDLFSKARRMRPCIIFFDEIDSIVPVRGSNQSGVTDRIVNQFLTELDGTEDRSGIFILATTSRADLIDKALLRPGRIDIQINLELPTENEISSILNSFSVPKKALNPLINFAKSHPNTISWADISAVDWENTEVNIKSFISGLLQSRPKKHPLDRNGSSRQRLSLS